MSYAPAKSSTRRTTIAIEGTSFGLSQMRFFHYPFGRQRGTKSVLSSPRSKKKLGSGTQGGIAFGILELDKGKRYGISHFRFHTSTHYNHEHARQACTGRMFKYGPMVVIDLPVKYSNIQEFLAENLNTMHDQCNDHYKEVTMKETHVPPAIRRFSKNLARMEKALRKMYETSAELNASTMVAMERYPQLMRSQNIGKAREIRINNMQQAAARQMRH